MPRYAAFLRGINLGSRRVTNDRLAEAFEGPGVANVAPFLASGNVVFDTDSAIRSAGSEAEFARRLAERLEAGLGFEVGTFLRPLARLAELAEIPPPRAADHDGFNVHVIFLDRPADPDVARALERLETGDDIFEIHGREVLWHRRGRMSDSEIRTADLDRALGDAGSTMRNMNTVRRIVAKFGAEA
jgi:uncharacterized protein (DUF1697 family)